METGWSNEICDLVGPPFAVCDGAIFGEKLAYFNIIYILILIQ